MLLEKLSDELIQIYKDGIAKIDLLIKPAVFKGGKKSNKSNKSKSSSKRKTLRKKRT